MIKEKVLTKLFRDHLESYEICHGFEWQDDKVELWLVEDGYKYYEKKIPLELFLKCLEDYFND